MSAVLVPTGVVPFLDAVTASGRHAGAFATTAALTALPADRRTQGITAAVIDGATQWIYDADSEAVAGSTVLLPDDEPAAGRWLLSAGEEGTALAALASTDTGDGASLVGIEDADGHFTAETVESALAELALRIQVATLTVGHADLTDTDAQQVVNFGAALPATAVVIGGYANVTAIFDNAGDTADVTFDLGFLAGDTDALVDAGSLNAVARVATPQGVFVPRLVGAVTPSVIFDGSVNLDTLTKGAATFYVLYVDVAELE